MNQAELAGIVCARICHDLASPIGAIVNGTDLIRELGQAESSEELAMVGQSAQRAAAVLEFHRLAFGAHLDPDASLAREQLHQRIAAVIAGPRVTHEWNVPCGEAINLISARLLCLMALAGRAMLGMGGAVRVLLPITGVLPAAVIVEGAKAAATDAQRGWIAGTNGVLPESRQIEFALIAQAAAAAGARLELVEAKNRLALRALPL